MADEWEMEMVKTRLRTNGVAGSDEFGRFVNDTRYFSASGFDERAAMPTLLGVLADLTDPKVVAAAAGHLRRPGLARSRSSHFSARSRDGRRLTQTQADNSATHSPPRPPPTKRPS